MSLLSTIITFFCTESISAVFLAAYLVCLIEQIHSCLKQSSCLQRQCTGLCLCYTGVNAAMQNIFYASLLMQHGLQHRQHSVVCEKV